MTFQVCSLQAGRDLRLLSCTQVFEWPGKLFKCVLYWEKSACLLRLNLCMMVVMVLLKWDCIQKPRHTSRKKIKPINQIKTSLACWKQCKDFSFSPPVDIFQVKVQTDNDDDYDERV